MRRLVLALLLVSAALAQHPARAAAPAKASVPVPSPGFWDGFRASIDRHLGRPYVWGATGLKSFDCSGFVWRVMWENRVFMKRTTARKLYFSLPPASAKDRWQFGNIIFFDNLKHCGIVNDRNSFYDAQMTRGTGLTELGPFWRPQICGVRRIRAAGVVPTAMQ